MDLQTFRKIFEQHVSAAKIMLEQKADYLQYPQISMYGNERYDHTLTHVSLQLPTLRPPEQRAISIEYGKQFKDKGFFHKDGVGAVFINQRLFFDTEKTKGNQVLLIFGLSTGGAVGETFLDINQKAGKLNKAGTIVFGYKREGREFNLLKAVLDGFGVGLPNIMPVHLIPDPDQFVHRIQLYEGSIS